MAQTVDKVGCLRYHVFWSVGEGGDGEFSKNELRLLTYRVRTIRGGKVYAYELSPHLTVDNKGNWLPRPEPLCRRSWRVGERPADFAASKAGAYKAALADFRRQGRHELECPQEHKKMESALKGGLTKSRKK